jgi:hypothetical protein
MTAAMAGDSPDDDGEFDDMTDVNAMPGTDPAAVEFVTKFIEQQHRAAAAKPSPLKLSENRIETRRNPDGSETFQ